jgi:hypothetical protein
MAYRQLSSEECTFRRPVLTVFLVFLGNRQMPCCGLRDDQWEPIQDLFPGREGHVGGMAADNRQFVEAVLYRYRAGIPWRDLLPRFGDWKNVHWRLITTMNT